MALIPMVQSLGSERILGRVTIHDDYFRCDCAAANLLTGSNRNRATFNYHVRHPLTQNEWYLSFFEPFRVN